MFFQVVYFFGQLANSDRQVGFFVLFSKFWLKGTKMHKKEVNT